MSQSAAGEKWAPPCVSNHCMQHPPRRQREHESWKTGGAECSSGSIRQRGETIAIQPKTPARRSWPQRAGRAEIHRNGEKQRWCAFRDPHTNTASDDRSVLGKGNGWRSSIVAPEGQGAKDEFRNFFRVCTASWPMAGICRASKPPEMLPFYSAINSHRPRDCACAWRRPNRGRGRGQG